MKLLISLSSKRVAVSNTMRFGNIQVTTVQEDKDLYSVAWRSLMTNVTTKMTKMGGKYFCSRFVGDANQDASKEFIHVLDDPYPATQYFFINADLYKQAEHHIKEARKRCGEFIRDNDTRVSSIKLTANKQVKNMQSMLGRKVKVGPNPDSAKDATLIDILPYKNKVVVKITEKGAAGKDRLSELPMKVVWIE